MPTDYVKLQVAHKLVNPVIVCNWLVCVCVYVLLGDDAFCSPIRPSKHHNASAKGLNDCVAGLYTNRMTHASPVTDGPLPDEYRYSYLWTVFIYESPIGISHLSINANFQLLGVDSQRGRYIQIKCSNLWNRGILNALNGRLNSL